MPTYEVTAPDGKRYRVTAPEGATDAQVRAMVERQVPEKPTSFFQGVAEGIQKPATNALRFMAKTNPILMMADQLGLSVAPRNIAGAIDREAERAKARSPNRGSTAGKITGEILGTLPSAFIPGGALAQGAAAGAMVSEKDDPLTIAKNAAIGAAAGKVGQQFGKRVVAPLAERAGRTAPVRKLGEVAARAVNKAPLPLPKITKPERNITRMAPQLSDARQNIEDAARLNLPFSLADADPRLRTLAGSVARFSPDARTMAERNIGQRALGQADRAVNAIDEHLAPVTDIERRSGVLRKLGSRASRPFYNEAFAQYAPFDDATAEMLRTPAGKDALRKAVEIASNEGRDPRALGFDLDDQGEVILAQAPSFETLDLVKRGLDARLNDFRNPVTGQLNLQGNPLAQSIEGLRKRLVGNLDRQNEAYPQARQAYQRFARRAEALGTGQKLAGNTVPQRQFDASLARLDDATRPEAQRGYSTAMADIVNKQRLARNPYDSVYGSPLQQSKVGALFPEGAQDFGRIYNLEKDMAQTATETLGGSQTQPRAVADSMFKDMAGDLAFDALSGGVPGAKSMVTLGLKTALKDRGNLGLLGAKKKADDLAPLLFDTSNPMGLLDFIDDMARKRAEEEIRKRAYQRSFGLLGVPTAGVGVGSTSP